MAFIFVTAKGVTLMDGRRGPLIYQSREAAQRMLGRLERMFGEKVEIQEYNPRYGEIRYGQGTGSGDKG